MRGSKWKPRKMKTAGSICQGSPLMRGNSILDNPVCHFNEARWSPLEGKKRIIFHIDMKGFWVRKEEEKVG